MARLSRRALLLKWIVIKLLIISSHPRVFASLSQTGLVPPRPDLCPVSDGTPFPSATPTFDLTLAPIKYPTPTPEPTEEPTPAVVPTDKPTPATDPTKKPSSDAPVPDPTKEPTMPVARPTKKPSSGDDDDDDDDDDSKPTRKPTKKPASGDDDDDDDSKPTKKPTEMSMRMRDLQWLDFIDIEAETFDINGFGEIKEQNQEPSRRKKSLGGLDRNQVMRRRRRKGRGWRQ